MIKLVGYAIAIIILGVIVYAVLTKREVKLKYVNPNIKSPNPNCSETAVSCEVDSDCAGCADSALFKLTCQSSGAGDDEKKYCLPERPKKPCNERNGGVWSWTGWSLSGNAEWECSCAFPEYYGNTGCTQLNPDVCAGGSFVYDSATGVAPSQINCDCPEGTVKIEIEKIPRCIPKNDTLCPDPETCRKFYDY